MIFLVVMQIPGLPLQIGIASSPNTFHTDRVLALKLLFRPHIWLNGPHIKKLEDAFKSFFSVKHAYAFESGRTALYRILKGWGVGEEDEVLLQAYTCVVVPDAVLWAGAKPVYVDVREDFNINPELIEEKITPKTKAIIIQHTFGLPADLEKIIPIAKKHNIKIIEDCAHVIGGRYRGELLGTFGDAAFFSFGQEKAISSVRGGMAVTNEVYLGTALEYAQKRMPYPSRINVFRRLMHPILWGIIVPTYYFFNLGKALLWISRKLTLTQFLVTSEEIRAKKPKGFGAKMANAQAAQALSQLKRVDRFNKKREEIVGVYNAEGGRWKVGGGSVGVGLPYEGEFSGPLLRYTVRVKDPRSLRDFAKKYHIILGNWYDNVIYPKETDLKTVRYSLGSCPVAERLSCESVNLPCYPRMTIKDAKRVVQAVKNFTDNASRITHHA